MHSSHLTTTLVARRATATSMPPRAPGANSVRAGQARGARAAPAAEVALGAGFHSPSGWEPAGARTGLGGQDVKEREPPRQEASTHAAPSTNAAPPTGSYRFEKSQASRCKTVKVYPHQPTLGLTHMGRVPKFSTGHLSRPCIAAMFGWLSDARTSASR